MSNFLEFSFEQNEVDQKKLESLFDTPFTGHDLPPKSILGNDIESVPFLMSKKIQKRFSCRLKHLIDQLEK
ncbi:MAG: hypothetical protein JRG97_04355 [Deltaproteobacteria bacterium]|nr:hypothetical protein [Deltaproteobacteria bacterium]MBW2051751.1 hypothetical protein [Deltaproteobacteria bacterium]MBW2140290.1 hypothetical protein [Deltaproteobacteria bacterium]MBW2322133.1 hypothetical protein [Deltaproteobacteria bacterium]